MQKVDRVKLLLGFNNYNELKSYFRKESYWSKNIVLNGKFNNGYFIEVSIEEKENSYSKYNEANLKIELVNDRNVSVENVFLTVDRISKVNSLFSIPHNGVNYLISIDKDVPLTKATAISRINIVKWNSLNYSYLSKLVLFNNFNNDMELLETVFAVLNSSVENIRNLDYEELRELLIEKLEYYGYSEEDTLETNQFFMDDSSKKVLSAFVGYLLAELYYPTHTEDRLSPSNMKDYVYHTVEKYLDLLVSEGKIKEK